MGECEQYFRLATEDEKEVSVTFRLYHNDDVVKEISTQTPKGFYLLLTEGENYRAVLETSETEYGKVEQAFTACVGNIDNPLSLVLPLKQDEKTIGKVHTGFCSFVQDLPSEPNSEKLKDLILAFCGVKDLGFDVPTKDYIKGAVEYYKGNVDKGDELTPCAFGDS